MRPIDSSYDARTSETRSADPGAATYALISDHGGPCSIVGDYASLAAAIEAARTMDTDAAPTDLEDEIDECADGQTVAWLVERAEAQGWRVVASAAAGEYWTVMVAGDAP